MDCRRLLQSCQDIFIDPTVFLEPRQELFQSLQTLVKDCQRITSASSVSESVQESKDRKVVDSAIAVLSKIKAKNNVKLNVGHFHTNKEPRTGRRICDDTFFR